MKEFWKNVRGYSKYIQVSSLGRVRTKDRFIPLNGGTIFRKGILCKQNLKKNGYFQVAIRMKKMRKWFLVHRLVAKAFVENPDKHPQVNHRDGNKENNSATNLEWCTSSFNQNHAVRTGLCRNEEKHYKAKLTKEDVIEIRKSKESSSVTALKFGVSKSNIKSIRRYKTWKYVA